MKTIALVGSGIGRDAVARALANRGFSDKQILVIAQPIADVLTDFLQNFEPMLAAKSMRRQKRKIGFGHRRRYTHGKPWAQGNRF